MARNEEKQLGRLNRLLLKHQKDEQEKKNPKRPRLDVINSADDIKQWLPNIKKDIDFCLKQSQVPCYPESKIKEFNQKIDHLQGEYKAFVRKLRKLDPNIKETPWTERSYKKVQEKKITESSSVYSEPTTDILDCGLDKNTNVKLFGEQTDRLMCLPTSYEETDTHSHSSYEQTDTHSQSYEQTDTHSNFLPIVTPILDRDSEYRTKFEYFENYIKEDNVSNVDLEHQDKALVFVKKDKSLPQCNLSRDLDENLTSSKHLVEERGNTLVTYSDSSDESDN